MCSFFERKTYPTEDNTVNETKRGVLGQLPHVESLSHQRIGIKSLFYHLAHIATLVLVQSLQDLSALSKKKRYVSDHD